MGVSTALPRRRRARLALACALACLSVAMLLPPARAGQRVEIADPPAVSDPLPAPGAVVEAGPVVIAARVDGADPAELAFLVDGEPAVGRPVDPDGDLSGLVGVEVTLPPGIHRIEAVVGDHGPLRSWQVVVSGLEVAEASEPATALAVRVDPLGPRTGPALLVDLGRPELGLAAPVLAARLDAVVVGVGQDVLTPAEWARIDATTGTPLVLGGPEGVADAVMADLTAAGRPAERIGGGSAAATVAAAMSHVDAAVGAKPTLVVAPAEPFDRALAGAVAAAELGADLTLVDLAPVDADRDIPLPEDVAAQVAAHPQLLLSADLPAASRDRVVAAMAEGAVASDDDLAPPAAQEAVVVADTADRGRAVVVAAAADADRPVLIGAAAAAEWVARTRPERVTVVTPTAPPEVAGPVDDPLLPSLATTPALDVDAVAADPVVPLIDPAGRAITGHVDDLATDLRRAWFDGQGAPAVEALLDAREGLSATVTAAEAVTDAVVHVSLHGYEWPGTTRVDGRRVTWRGGDRPPLPLPLEPGGRDAPVPVVITTAITTGTGERAATRHQRFESVVGLDPSDTVSPEGWVVAGGSDAQVGEGRVVTYSVEVEPETGLDVAAVEAEVTAILTDPRSWTADGMTTPGGAEGGIAWRRVGLSQLARIRVVVARPATVDDLCGRVGLRTGGRVSCWDGYRAMLNLDRWTVGVPPFHADLGVYREYLVNHEVGHGLGHGHEYCTTAGALAPVMMQQTGGLGACRANGWPFPEVTAAG